MPRSFALIPLAAALCAAGAVHAQTRPWYVGGAQAFATESNVNAGGRDTSSTTSLRGGVNTMFGRQQVRADGTLRHQRYDENSVLNNNGHDLTAALDWATAGALSGNVTGLSSERLARITSPNATPGVTFRNLEYIGDIGARVRLGEFGPLGIEVGGGARTLNYSAPEFDDREYRQRRANAGVNWAPGGPLSLGAGVSVQKYVYPRFAETTPEVFLEDRSRRRDVYFTARWVPTGRSIVDGRLAVGKNEYDVDVGRNFSGVTGNINWNWQPTAKLRLLTTFAREIGEESAYSTLSTQLTPAASGGTGGTGSTGGTGTPPPTTTTPGAVPGGLPVGTSFQALARQARVVNQFAVRADFEATAKISLTSALVFLRPQRSGGDTPAAAATDTRSNVTNFSLGARWQPTRTLTVGCDATAERTDGVSAGGTDSSNSFGCFGQFLIN